MAKKTIKPEIKKIPVLEELVLSSTSGEVNLVIEKINQIIRVINK